MMSKLFAPSLALNLPWLNSLEIDIKDKNVSIVMSNVACRGTESALGSCSHTDGDDNCVDDTGAQAMCEPSKLAIEIS